MLKYIMKHRRAYIRWPKRRSVIFGVRTLTLGGLCICALSGISLSPLAVELGNQAHAQSQTTDIRPNAQQVTGDDLLNAFKGRTHDGAYNFNIQGLARANYQETHHDDGSLTYREGDEMFKGVWIVHPEKLCFRYKENRLGGGCFRVYQVKNCYYFYSDRLPRHDNELNQNYWTARSVFKGETPKCVAAIS